MSVYRKRNFTLPLHYFDFIFYFVFEGKTHRLGTNAAGDDDVMLEVVIQMADCAGADNNTAMVLSIGNKLASYIFIYDHDVTVFRDGNEKPDLQLLLSGTILSRYDLVYLKEIYIRMNKKDCNREQPWKVSRTTTVDSLS